ncbi:MAG: hypothetical protein H7Y00_02375 [Fimbriimonadaceae bacterium]|nr:hypothetical protein [Chitinophagales bacterium]
MFSNKIYKKENSTTSQFFSPVIQKEENGGINKNCPTFSDSKDLTWAAAKHFLETEMPDKILGVVPESFKCFDEKGMKGCRILLKSGEDMLVFFTEIEIHVQRPNKKENPEVGYCKYEYSCDGGNISFKKIKCLKTW